MGKLHTRVFSQMPTVRLVGVHDADPDYAQAAADAYNTKAFASLDDLLAQVKAVVVAVPTKFHLDVARACIARGVHMLIEKPLAATVAECEEIAARAGEAGVVVQVGHVERFNPAVRAMTRLHIEPKFIEVTRVSPLTFRSIDVGVVLDMMIHDIDIVLLLAGGSPIESVEATGVSVLGAGKTWTEGGHAEPRGGHAGPEGGAPAEDVCNARVKFASGCVANLTASRLALKTERKLRVFSADAYVSLDYQKKYAMVARRTENLAAIRDAVAKIRSGEIEDLTQLNYSDLVSVEELQIDDTEPLRAELDAFIHAITTNTRPLVSAQDGLAAVRLAQQITHAIGGASL